MFHRLHFDAWQINFPLVGFWLFFVVFLVLSWRVLRMPRQKIEELSNMPLEQDQPEIKHDTDSNK